MFASTLGMPKRTIMNWIQADNETTAVATDEHSAQITTDNTDDVIINSTMLNANEGRKRASHNALPVRDNNFITEYLSSLATVPSHYCINACSHMKFLESGTTLVSLYDEYRARAEASNLKNASYPIFSKHFHSENYSVFVTRKDQCDVYLGAKHGSVSQTELAEHRAKKARAQQEKESDKAAAKLDPTLSVWTMDVQAVMIYPKTAASCMFYKTKLKLHNFTLYSLDTQEGYCYAWDECNGGFYSDIFAWLQYSNFKKLLNDNQEITNIIWSDGCGYQNRNATLSNAYCHLSRLTRCTITQKFLVSGHSQMECDSMHSCIECKCIGPMFSPRDYIVVMQGARVNPMPYHVEHLSYGDFMPDFNGGYISSIRPGKKAGDETVNKFRSLRYSTTTIEYQVDFDAQFAPLPQRIKPSTIELTHKYTELLPITARKYNDLQELKAFIPNDMHAFYDNLPHD